MVLAICSSSPMAEVSAVGGSQRSPGRLIRAAGACWIGTDLTRVGGHKDRDWRNKEIQRQG